VPTQVVSNEEYLPIPETPQQRLLEQEIIASAERQVELHRTPYRTQVVISASILLQPQKQFLADPSGPAL